MKKTILFVDDSVEIAKIIRLYLSMYEVHYEENPVKAFEWLNNGNLPDLIISDINMPEYNGNQFLEYLKSNSLFSDIPVMILSSEDSSSVRIHFYELGAVDFLIKPFNPEELRVRVKRIIK